MAELRDYQITAVAELRDAISTHRTAVYVLPTGGGKTVVAAELARLAAEKGNRTLLLVHRRELVKQAIDTLSEACPGLSVGVEAAGWPSMPWAMLHVGMVQSIFRREYVQKPDLVVVDEAHHSRAATFEEVLARWHGAAMVGLTATPERLDSKGLWLHFNVIVFGPSIPVLVAADRLAPCRTLRLPASIDTKGVRKGAGGDYQRKDLGERVTSRTVTSAADAYMEYAKGMSTIFFGVTRAHSRAVCEKLRAYGIKAEHVDGTDHTSRRDKIMSLFKSGGVTVVGNVDLISEGFDAPACECVMMGAPTKSITRFLQMAGRAMRPGPGKTALILDLEGSSHELGLPDEEREWSLEDGEVKKKKKTNLIECPNCHTLYYRQPCPHCGQAPPVPSFTEQKRSLEIATARLKPKRSKRSEVWGQLAQAKRAGDVRSAVTEIAERRGYKEGWVGHILRSWGME